MADYIAAPAIHESRPVVSPQEAGKVYVSDGVIELEAADMDAGDLIGLAVLPANCIPVDFDLFTDDLDTGTALAISVGVLNDDQDDLAAGTLILTDSTVGRAGGRAQAAVFPIVEPSDKDRIIAAKITAGGIAEAKATCKVTSDETNVTAGKKVVVNGTTYTFVDGVPQSEGDVSVGDDAAASLANLANAITRSEPDTNNGINYLVTAAHTTVGVKSITATVLTLEALAAGADGNAFTCTTDDDHLAVDANQFDGGVTAVPLQAGTMRGVLKYRAAEYGE